ncbi:hypothetical protein Bbelb_440500 [Branchiostoma belcheri]|nr:hypothetical protein Bbelb_440500 [Branchiostoma belcheri]
MKIAKAKQTRLILGQRCPDSPATPPDKTSLLKNGFPSPVSAAVGYRGLVVPERGALGTTAPPVEDFSVWACVSQPTRTDDTFNLREEEFDEDCLCVRQT